MSFTLGGILMGALVLLCLLGTLGLLLWLGVRHVERSWRRDFPATKLEPAPPQWESRLADVQADLVSLSSSFEKVTKAVTRQNAREEMRERRRAKSGSADGEVPPMGASKTELYRHYGLAGKTSTQIAQMALDLVRTEDERTH